ncbi:MAG: LysM repeat protein [Cellvibrionaceae bacterium]
MSIVLIISFFAFTIPLAAQTNIKSAVYTIQNGDPLSSISQKFGVSLAEIAASNNIVNLNWIWAGQSLILPADLPNGATAEGSLGTEAETVESNEAQPAAGIGGGEALPAVYVVQSGDTMSQIAAEFDIPV